MRHVTCDRCGKKIERACLSTLDFAEYCTGGSVRNWDICPWCVDTFIDWFKSAPATPAGADKE